VKARSLVRLRLPEEMVSSHEAVATTSPGGGEPFTDVSVKSAEMPLGPAESLQELSQQSATPDKSKRRGRDGRRSVSVIR
jgi:hypothetical protein